MISLTIYSYCILFILLFFFFFNDTATTEIYTLSLHDALPIYEDRVPRLADLRHPRAGADHPRGDARARPQRRSEEHTSELQSQSNLVCRLLLEKKKKQHYESTPYNPNKLILPEQHH